MEKSASCFHQAADNEPLVQPPSNFTGFSAAAEPVVLWWERVLLPYINSCSLFYCFLSLVS